MSFEPLYFLVERLFDLVKHEATLLLADEKEEIESLQRELQLIESYLKDIDEVQRQANLSHVLKTKLQHLMQIVHEIEDFLDQLMDQKRQQEQQAPKRLCLGFTKAFSSSTSNPLTRKHHLATRVAEMRSKLEETLKRPEGYQLPNNSSKRRRRTTPYIAKDEIIIGLEEDVSTLVAKFLGKDGERAANSAIIGMGGAGKTTLAKMFYNHKEIQEAFLAGRAWVCVSQEWNAQALLLEICRKLGLNLSKDDKMIADVKLQEFLERRACLVVLDDVWEQEALLELFPALLSGSGRVLVTTRKEKVVNFPTRGPFYRHRVRPLTSAQSWELFSRIVRNCCDGRVNFEEDESYVELGKEMLQKCNGLPLAIIALAGLLGTKSNIQQWENIKDRVIQIIMRDDIDNGSHDYDAVKTILELSYSDLPYYMKPCFLYLGTFQEDAEIEASNLIKLWINEGFIKPDQCPENSTLEEVAMDFLEELVQRCMVQVISRDISGDAIVIGIHDLMRDLCITKAKELGFFQVFSPSSNTTSKEIKSPCYRAIIYKRRDVVLLDNTRIRTLIYNQQYDRAPQLVQVLSSFTTLNHLRILQLKMVVMDDSAKHIGNTVLLRHLELSYCFYKFRDWRFIKKLRNLQALMLDFYGLNRLPLMVPDNMVDSMEQLRYLYLDVNWQNGTTLLGMANLRSLQTLEIREGQLLAEEYAAIRSISSLRELTLLSIRGQAELEAIYGCLRSTSAHLENLWLAIDTDTEQRVGFDLQKMTLAACQQRLKALRLSGKIIKQHEPAMLLPSKLMSLILSESQIEEEEDMKRVLAPLDHLRALTLEQNAFIGDKLIIAGLPQLQELTLADAGCLKECIITEGSLPQLKQLNISKCSQLERIPDGISNIHTLQCLEVRGMPERFCKRLQKREDGGGSNGGEDFHLVQHIPTIHIGLAL